MLIKRKDGKLSKNADPYFKVMANIMSERNDAHVYYSQDMEIENVEEFLREQRKEGQRIGYMHIVYTALIRLLYEKPHLNRFVMRGRLYDHNNITISLVVKKPLSKNEETVIKIDFEGTETIYEVKEKLDAAINENQDSAENVNNTDHTAEILAKIPSFLARWVVGFCKFLDKRNLMPKAIIDVSPFHASAFLTNVGSIGLDAVYHHIYNFGTIGTFVAMGKKKRKIIFKDDVLKEAPFLGISFVADERIASGVYFASAMKLFERYIKNPELLKERPKDEEEELEILPVTDIYDEDDEIDSDEKSEKEKGDIISRFFRTRIKKKRKEKQREQQKQEQQNNQEQDENILNN